MRFSISARRIPHRFSKIINPGSGRTRSIFPTWQIRKHKEKGISTFLSMRTGMEEVAVVVELICSRVARNRGCDRRFTDILCSVRWVAVMFAVFYVVVVASLGFLLRCRLSAITQLQQWRARQQGRCWRCGYDMRATPESMSGVRSFLA
jgi:hypothetical protein